MTREEFDIGIGRLRRVFNPYRWTDDQESEYFLVFQGWPFYKWNSAVTKAVTECKKMPTPYDLRKLAGEVTEGEKTKQPTNVPLLDGDGCPDCHRGMVFFEVVKDGSTYEHFAACDCEAGNRIAKHLVKMARLSGRPRSLSEVRYHHIFGGAP